MPKQLGILVLLAILTLITGGALIYLIATQPAPVEVSEYILITPNPSASSTATPFQPIRPTSTPTPIYTATATATPTPTPTPTRPSPTPWDKDIDIPEDQIKILVLGSDERPGGGFRTDVVMLVIINPQQDTVSVVSFPRDLWVFIPGWGMNRINTAMSIGGFNMIADTLQHNFGVRPDHYFLTNFSGFTEIIDRLGGITIEASQAVTDKCDVSWGTLGYCTVEAGSFDMDGATALWYVRSRYSSSDFDRTRRQQEVLKGIADRLISIDGVRRAPELYKIYKDNVETDMGLSDILPLVKIAPQIAQSENIRRYAVGPGQVYDYVVPESGAWVLVPNEYAVRAMIQEAISTP